MHTLFKKNGEKHRCFVLQMQIVDPYSSEVESVVKRRVGCPSLESNLFVWHIDTSQTFLSQPKVKTVHLKSELFVTYTILEEKVNMNVNKAKCRRGVVVITTAQPHSTKAWTQLLRRLKPCSRRVGDSRWWRSLTMISAGNKAKRLSLVNHTTKTIHHHHHDRHHHVWYRFLKKIMPERFVGSLYRGSVSWYLVCWKIFCIFFPIK